MKIDILERKITKIHDLLLEILEQLNKKLDLDPTFQNIAEFLLTHNLISEPYAQKIRLLDKSDQFCVERPLLHKELNDIEFYLLSRFYHYI